MIKIDQYAVDWKEDFDLNMLNKLAKPVGGEKCLQEYHQDTIDAKVIYVCSRRLNYDELEQLWNAAELWSFSGPIHGKTVEEIVRKAAKLNQVESMREDLASTAPDHWSGSELGRYQERIQNLSPAALIREYKKCFGDKEPGDFS